MIQASPKDGFELLRWKKIAKDGLPDSDLTVLAFSPEANEPVWLMFHDGECWVYPDGTPTHLAVTHWAEMPAGPNRTD